MRMRKAILVLAAVYGAAGVALLAAGSHAAPGNVTVAGQMLLFHAPALIAIFLAIGSRALHRAVGLAAVAILALGVGLFSIDLSLRGLGFGRLFVMAAPIGGSMTILGWVVLAAAAALGKSAEPE